MKDFDCYGIVALVLDENADIAARDEALYGVLCKTLRPRLERRFRPYVQRVPMTFDDALQDFFLYLRGSGRDAYSAVRKLKDMTAFDAWILTAFRNFVSKKARGAGCDSAKDLSNVADNDDDTDQETLRIGMLSKMIAYCYQELPLVQRFVFLRMMLTYLDKDRALPQKDVAMVLGMSHVYYRVLNNRVRSFTIQVREALMRGEDLQIHPSGAILQEGLAADFEGWYDILSGYYAKTIDQFAQSEAIYALRSRNGADSSGMLLHDVVCAGSGGLQT